MSKITAEVICDSIATHNRRLTTFLTRYPRFVHAEMCRHRAMSLCVSSSRAIPTSRYLEIVRSDEERAEPAFWGAAQKGMSPGKELSDYPEKLNPYSVEPYRSRKVEAQILWMSAARDAAYNAERMIELGVHKSIINRLLDPFVPVNVLVTCCEPGLLNWFGLRLDRSADPTIRALAEAMWAAWNESRPRKLEPGQWHLPFADDLQTKHEIDQIIAGGLDYELWLSARRKVSTARCARVSYLSYETNRRSTVEEDLALYDRLITARPIHASPAEHQATPDTWEYRYGEGLDGWNCPELHGNLPGFIQHRKTLPSEAVAPLPEGYEYQRPMI